MLFMGYGKVRNVGYITNLEYFEYSEGMHDVSLNEKTSHEPRPRNASIVRICGSGFADMFHECCQGVGGFGNPPLADRPRVKMAGEASGHLDRVKQTAYGNLVLPGYP